ncbi:MAG: sugar ABC transporter permease [Eubacteriales bacterium]
MAGKINKKKTVSYDKYGYYFVLPFIIAFLLFQLYPIVYTINLSFTGLAGWDTTYEYIKLDNYTYLLNNKLFWNSLKNTVIIWSMNFIPQIGVALLLAAWFTSVKIKVRGKGLYKVLFYFPGIITAASVAILFRALENYPTGPINSILLNLGILSQPFEFLQSKMAARASVAFMQFWMYYGSTMIMLIAGILAIDTSLYEAAMIDGANDKVIFRKITLPLIKPIMLYVLVTSLIGGFQIFDIPFLFTGGGPDNSIQTIAMYIYYQAFTSGRNFGIASAAAVILLIIIALLSACIFKFLQEDK